MKKLTRISLFLIAALLSQGIRANVPVDSICADFDLFISYLEETHPDPYSAFGGRPLFFEESRNVRQGLIADSVSDPEVLADRIAAFVSRLHDGHTYINRPADDTSDPRFAPVIFRHVADGLTIRGVPDSLKHLIGSKVEAINGTDIESVREKFASLITAENESGEFENLRQFINDERYIKKLFPDFNSDSICFSLIDPTGKSISAILPLKPFSLINIPEFTRPQSSLKLPGGNMESCFIGPDEATAYFRFGSVNSRDNFTYMKDNGMDYSDQLRYYYRIERKDMPENIEDAIAVLPVAVDAFGDLLETMKERGTRNLIIDLRGNDGGWTPIVYPMLYQLFGKDMVGMESGVTFYRVISPLFLKKMNITIDDFNRANGLDCKPGDFLIFSNPALDRQIDDAALDSYIDRLMTLNPERLKAQKGKPVYRPENIFVLTDGATFSAAFHTAFYLWKLGATIAGVPSCQAPNTFMEMTGFTLPRTGLTGSISNSLQLFLPPTDENARELKPELTLDYERLAGFGFDPDAEVMMVLEGLK